MTSTETKKPQPSRHGKWRWKKPLVAVLLVMVLLGWVCHLAYQNALAAELKEHGAEIKYRSGSVVSIWFRGEGCCFGDSEMESLASFPHLERLDLTDAQVTNSGLAHVKGLSQLARLSVLAQQITDQRERELKEEMRYLTIEKLRNIDGRKVVDGFE